MFTAKAILSVRRSISSVMEISRCRFRRNCAKLRSSALRAKFSGSSAGFGYRPGNYESYVSDFFLTWDKMPGRTRALSSHRHFGLPLTPNIPCSMCPLNRI